MKNKKDIKCIGCSERKRCQDSFSSWLFFIIGLIATVAMRVVTVLMHLEPIYGKIAWYIGLTGFFLFFVYKYKVSQSRSRLIKESRLVEKISKKENMTERDYDLIGTILCALSSKKERINYFFIFGLSALALILALYFDFIK